MYIGLHAKYPLLLSDFNETWIPLTDVREIFNWESSCLKRTEGQADGRTGMTKLIVAFLNFANAPDNTYFKMDVLTITGLDEIRIHW